MTTTELFENQRNKAAEHQAILKSKNPESEWEVRPPFENSRFCLFNSGEYAVFRDGFRCEWPYDGYIPAVPEKGPAPRVKSVKFLHQWFRPSKTN